MRRSIAIDEEYGLKTMSSNSNNRFTKYEKDSLHQKADHNGFIYRFWNIRTLAFALIAFSILDIVFLILSSVTYSNKTAIIVLGGGVTEKGDCPPHTKLRLEKAFALYKKYKEEYGAFIIPLSGGTPYKPNPVDGKGFPIWEATAAAKELIKMGISPQDILEEAFSLDTVGNV